MVQAAADGELMRIVSAAISGIRGGWFADSIHKLRDAPLTRVGGVISFTHES